MGFYSRHIFSRFYDLLMDQPHWAGYRRAQLAGVAGDVLEIGVGTGLNLPHYPKTVHRITTVDPNPGMNRVLRKRAAACGVDVDPRVISGEHLPFDDATFDCVVSTLTLCSIPKVDQALAEVYRVLKPGGCVRFLEHGVSPDANVRRWQLRLNPLQRCFADGCRLDLDIGRLLRKLPFAEVELDNFYMEKTPKIHGYMYRGVARK